MRRQNSMKRKNDEAEAMRRQNSMKRRNDEAEAIRRQDSIKRKNDETNGQDYRTKMDIDENQFIPRKRTDLWDKFMGHMKNKTKKVGHVNHGRRDLIDKFHDHVTKKSQRNEYRRNVRMNDFMNKKTSKRRDLIDLFRNRNRMDVDESPSKDFKYTQRRWSTK